MIRVFYYSCNLFILMDTPTNDTSQDMTADDQSENQGADTTQQDGGDTTAVTPEQGDDAGSSDNTADNG
jgi:hypothetical protein